MTTEPKLPPFRGVSRTRERAEEVRAYGLQCFEAGRQQGMAQERALAGLFSSTEELEDAAGFCRLAWGSDAAVFNDGVNALTDCLKQRAAGLAASSQEIDLGPPWHAIETAPLGPAVLLWWRTCPHAMRGRYVSDERGEGWMCDGDQVIPINQSDCTHWMPLPSPPKA